MNIYIGNYIEVLTKFNQVAGVDTVISEKRNVSDEIVTYCDENEISLFLAESGDHLHQYLNSIEKCKLCIIASFGLILKEHFIKKVDWLVNLHPGSLFTSRGRHPLPFAIKKGLSFMTLTAHLIQDEKIDNGPFVAEINIPIDYEKSYQYNDHKLRGCLPFLTQFVVQQYQNEDRIFSSSIDLTGSLYNNRLEGSELEEMMSAKNLLKYKKA
jgi:methionyl-tRNA formyltransferase